MIGEFHSFRLDPRRQKGFPILGLIKLIIGMPFIYVLIVPIALLDALVSLYQWVCFPIYRLPQVRRTHFVQHRRKGLESLNAVDRLNCYYCSYANGVLRYAQKISSETEKMWCPIRHKLSGGFVQPAHHAEFAENGKKEVLQAYYQRQHKRIPLLPADAAPECGDEAVCPETPGSAD